MGETSLAARVCAEIGVVHDGLPASVWIEAIRTVEARDEPKQENPRDDFVAKILR